MCCKFPALPRDTSRCRWWDGWHLRALYQLSLQSSWQGNPVTRDHAVWSVKPHNTRCSLISISFSKLLSSPLIVLLIRGSSRPDLDQLPEQASRPITCLIASLKETLLSPVMLYLKVIQLLWEEANGAAPRLETAQLLKTHLGGRHWW